MTRQDKTRQDKTRQGKARQDKARQGKARQDKTRQDSYAALRQATLRQAKLRYAMLSYAKLRWLSYAMHSQWHSGTDTTPSPPIPMAQCHPYDGLPANSHGTAAHATPSLPINGTALPILRPPRKSQPTGGPAHQSPRHSPISCSLVRYVPMSTTTSGSLCTDGIGLLSHLFCGN